MKIVHRRLSLSELLALAWIVGFLLLVTLARWLPLADPVGIDLSRTLVHPTPGHWSGTDELGRDVLSRLIFGGQSTFLVTIGATALAMFLGIVLGLCAGYRGGLLDRALGFAIDLFWSIPFVIFVILIVSIVGVSPLTLILTIGGINWVTAARVVRAETARLSREPFVRTARAYGFGEWSVAFDQVMPNLKSVLITLTVYAAVEVLTLETGLAFIGLSLPAPRPTWGGLLADGLSYFSSAWWLVAFSAGAITLTLASFQVLAMHFEKSIETRLR